MALAAPTRKQLTLLKNDIVSVRKSIKTGKNLDKSEETVRRYLADTLYKQEQVRLQHLLCDVLKKAYEVGNEKMYLRQPTDTLCLLNTGKRMFLAYEKLDSLDSSVRKRNATYLMPYRTNIFMGGIYLLHHKAWQEAWQSFDIYLDCPRQPLFSGQNIDAYDHTARRVAFLSLVAAYRLDSLPLALKYADRAVLSRQSEKAYEILSEMSLIHRDTLNSYKYLSEGFKAHRKSHYLFTNLLEYLRGRERYAEALDLCNAELAIDSLNADFLLGKHIILYDLQRYDEAITWGDKAIAVSDSLPTAYYNIGTIYYQRAQSALKKQGKPYRQRLREAQKCFRRLLPYMERYRHLAPSDAPRWKPALYDAYLNLNMGKEFREISK
jgi:hypothetical protein